jgi:hypothetical protein
MIESSFSEDYCSAHEVVMPIIMTNWDSVKEETVFNWLKLDCIKYFPIFFHNYSKDNNKVYLHSIICITSFLEYLFDEKLVKDITTDILYNNFIELTNFIIVIIKRLNNMKIEKLDDIKNNFEFTSSKTFQLCNGKSLSEIKILISKIISYCYKHISYIVISNFNTKVNPLLIKSMLGIDNVINHINEFINENELESFVEHSLRVTVDMWNIEEFVILFELLFLYIHFYF